MPKSIMRWMEIFSNLKIKFHYKNKKYILILKNPTHTVFKNKIEIYSNSPKSMHNGEGKVRATRISTNMAILQELLKISLPHLQHSSNRAKHKQAKLLHSFVFY